MISTANSSKQYDLLLNLYIESTQEQKTEPVSESSRVAMQGREWEVTVTGKKKMTAHPQVVFTAKSGKLFNKA